MHYSNIKYFDVANGPGIRTSLFVSGCESHCPGCFNPETWDRNNGKSFTDTTMVDIFKSIDTPYCEGLSLLGGDPLAPYNLEEIEKIIDKFREKFGWDKTIWMWTGYLLEDIMSDTKRGDIVKKIDYLVDGPFILERKNLKLKYRGSENQRIINIQNSLTFNDLICNYMWDE